MRPMFAMPFATSLWRLWKYALTSTYSIYSHGRWIRDLAIGKRDLVLDVGAGHHPFPRADVLIDKFVDSPQHRARDATLSTDSRPFVMGDAENLPFQDGSFDFVVCRQVLEHVPNPCRLVSELNRVGKRGYIETPSPLSELVHGGFPSQQKLAEACGLGQLLHGPGQPGHRRFVVTDGKRLITCEKTEAEFLMYLMTGHALKQHADYDRHRFQSAHAAWFLTTHVWDESHPLTIETLKLTGQEEAEAGDYDLAAEIRKLRALKTVRDGSRRIPSRVAVALQEAFFGRRIGHDELLPMLVCPLCRGGLKRSLDRLACEPCGTEFPIVCGCPILMNESANRQL